MTDVPPAREKYGIMVFLVLALVLVAIAVIVADRTGPVGIEERFSSAVGIVPGAGDDGEVPGGFPLEGHPLLYGIFLILLATGCIILYRKYRI